MIPWIAEGEKFSLIGLQTATDSSVSDGPIAEGLEAYTSLKLDMPGHWREWLGTMRVEDIEASTLILVSRQKSRSPKVLDGENQFLGHKVGRWLTGLQLVCPLSVYEEPINASGCFLNGELDVRQVGTLHRFHDNLIDLRREVSVDHLVDAAGIVTVLERLMENPGPHLWRLMRCLEIYQKARTLADPMDRVHQFVRCIEGMLATTTGNSRSRFKSRTELFIGPNHHELMGAIFDKRSEVEHLHEDESLVEFDRTKRLEIAKMEVMVSELARYVLHRILSDSDLALRLGSKKLLEDFWGLEAPERRAIWGEPYDLMSPLKGFREDWISDRDLGADYP
ncbi:hypothetical protein [Devosia beringensis]|uniref:hypothetical protein n=1 Tax=Devosia beringensis TaxID=2657486 RepID=UPI00186B7753|nr:hypothetical protein [Devosia beringensis]